jgi:hypothetical protein
MNDAEQPRYAAKIIALLTALVAIAALVAGLTGHLDTIVTNVRAMFRQPKTATSSPSPTTSNLVQDRIRNGEQFRILLYTTIGPLGANHGYAARYDRNAETLTVSGPIAGSWNQSQSKAYPSKDLEHNVISVWGHAFQFDSNSHLIDTKLGDCGTIYFDSDVKPKSH